MAEKIRVGIIGIGSYAVFQHVPTLRKIDNVELVAVSRRTPHKLAIAKRELGIPEGYTDWRQMLDKAALDAVVVTTPNYMHADPTVAALDHGLHVLVEKPMALTTKDAHAMVRAAERNGKTLMVGYPFRVSELMKAVRDELRAGTVGTLRQADLTFSVYRRWMYWEAETLPEELQEMSRKYMGMPDEWFGDWSLRDNFHRDPKKSGGGSFVDNGTHMVDTALWLLGAGPAEVVAFSDTEPTPVECFMNVQARLTNGVLLSISAADVVSTDRLGMLRNRLEIVGENGSMVFQKDAGAAITRDGATRKIEASSPGRSVDAAFIDLIRNGGDNPAPGSEAAQTVALTEAAYQSIAEKRIIAI